MKTQKKHNWSYYDWDAYFNGERHEFPEIHTAGWHSFRKLFKDRCLKHCTCGAIRRDPGEFKLMGTITLQTWKPGERSPEWVKPEHVVVGRVS